MKKDVCELCGKPVKEMKDVVILFPRDVARHWKCHMEQKWGKKGEREMGKKEIKYCRDCETYTVHEDGVCVKEHMERFNFPTEL